MLMLFGGGRISPTHELCSPTLLEVKSYGKWALSFVMVHFYSLFPSPGLSVLAQHMLQGPFFCLVPHVLCFTHCFQQAGCVNREFDRICDRVTHLFVSQHKLRKTHLVISISVDAAHQRPVFEVPLSFGSQSYRESQSGVA